jgi:hypothetical protein
MSRDVYEGFSEAYEVVKTVQVVGENNKTYKVEILEDIRAVGSSFEETRFFQRVYVEAEIDANVVTNRNNRVAINRYVGSPRFGTQTVDDQSPTDHYIMHVLTVPLSRRP